MARALHNMTRGHIGAPQPNTLVAAANRPTQTPVHLQPQASDLLNQLQTRIRSAAQNRDYQELQRAQLEIDRVIEGQKPQFLELRRALESGNLTRNPAFESLKNHHDQKEKFIAILDSFKNTAGVEMQRIVQTMGGYVPHPWLSIVSQN